MGFEAGHKKLPNAGRKPGTPNKATQAIIKICEEEGVDPIRAMARIMKSGNKKLELKAAAELAQYIYPKRKALEVTLGDLSDDELASEVQTRLGDG